MKPTAILKLVRALIASGVTRFEGFGISFDVRPAQSPLVGSDEPNVFRFRDGRVAEGITKFMNADFGERSPMGTTEPPAPRPTKQDTLAELIGKPRPSRNVE